MDQQNENLFDLHLDDPSFSYFREAAKWARFIAIVGFIFCGILVLFAFFAGTIFATLTAGLGGYAPIGGGLFTIVYLVFALLWFFPFLYLYRFASQMQLALHHKEQLKLQNSFKNLKSYFRFMGILFIVVLSIYALGIVMAIVGGIASM